ncbi:CYTH domain-containing protein [Lactobacillus kefiranofaciens]|uniref:CYTH domain-containing protein n=1 Tax=Lactobacillus kefiranofaciens TaxID=267818 RepID=A0AAX3UEB6_9LACO|nr:CYTH domain-containing protein [Lactobacillus kefiranofaciens]AEG40696.1 Adenylate cyclase [Lactobacillus kefiranofaciens subsp. kefiranofaciens]KRL24796.1 adenylate cyclase [Lactobacillus kefiranofaciens subsp. kefirgranum DSM 10550 = JCM 8572]KRM22729.1 adenylate cyclase [Lactobacillus kefiranofaciens subsp. kefiranofaciens DSM 5016 = JCM 6985]MCJ2171877.1 CYTH domain-containing protein [Lactobacillus kefiranofaciens]MDF4142420.1 CYTH domain-containing protein [Lactobacillus kefiranofacie
MSKNREIEAKTLLTKNIYEKITHSFPVKQDFVQENYYFDTPNSLLKKHQISLRIRIYADHAEQTMKVPDPNPVQKNFHEVIEINDNLTHAEAKKLVAQKHFTFQGNIGHYLNEHFKQEQKDLALFTWSKTRRILMNGPKNAELTLDATSYPDGYQDFELEIENTNPKLIGQVQQVLEYDYDFSQTSTNTNQSKIARANAHRK